MSPTLVTTVADSLNPSGVSYELSAFMEGVTPDVRALLSESVPKSSSNRGTNAADQISQKQQQQQQQQQRAPLFTVDLWKPLAIIAVQLGVLRQVTLQATAFSSTSIWVPAVSTIAYLAFVFAGKYAMRKFAPFQDLERWMLSYNLYQCILNTYCVGALCIEAYRLGYSVWGNSIIPESDPRGRRMAFLIFLHFQNKITELADTVFMVLRKKEKQLTFMHLYHHLLLLWSWFLVVKFACGGDAYFGALINSATHILLYGFYLMCTIGWTCPWKRVLTQIQIGQFGICTLHGIYCLCRGNYPRWLVCLELFVQLNMLILFGRFYRKTYNESVCTACHSLDQCIGDTAAMVTDVATAVASTTKEGSCIVDPVAVSARQRAGATLQQQNITSSPGTDTQKVGTSSPEQATTASTTAVTGNAVKEYTLAEVRRHCTPEDSWVAIHGFVYNITGFLKKHPGGDVINLASGQDATILFETYHARGVSKKITDKYMIGKLNHGDKSNSYYSWTSPFYATLRKRVVDRLRELGYERRGGAEIWVKAIAIMLWFWGSLVGMCFAPSYAYATLAAVSMGVSGAFVGTCIQHDGNHGAFGKSSLLNKMAGWTLDMIGASAFTWEIQHVLGHHPYTNLLDVAGERRKGVNGTSTDVTSQSDCVPDHVNQQESDPDVFSSYPLMRMHPFHKHEWYHCYQHIYGPVIFAAMTLSKVFQQDFELVRDKQLYHINGRSRYDSVANVARFWFMKACSLVYMAILPCYFRGSILSGMSLFVIGHLVCGEFLATMFIVNHVIDGVAFATRSETPDGSVIITAPATSDGKSPMKRFSKPSAGAARADIPANDWAAVQCQTSVNWASGSWFWNHFSGGLNHQIEHHLFPGICHTNYVHIQPVVEATCREFGVPYQSEPSFGSAYRNMIHHLWKMGSATTPSTQ